MSEPRPLVYGSEILRRIFASGGISRAELAEALNLDRATVTRIVRELLKKNYLEEYGVEEQSEIRQGRKRILLSVSERMGCSLGFEIQQDTIKAAAVLPSGRLLLQRTFSRNADTLVSVRDLEFAVETLKHDVSRKGFRVLGAGFALSGIVDPVAGIFQFNPVLGKKSRPLPVKQELEQRICMPVFLDNDAKCCCYDVLGYSNPGALDDFLYIFCELPEDPAEQDRFLRVQLGMALVVKGQVLYGSRNAAGEYRSVFADVSVPGQFGHIRSDYFCYIKSDEDRRKEFFKDLARNVAFIANFLDLQSIYLGGGIERYKQEFTEALKSAVKATWLYEQYIPRTVPVYFAESDEKPAVRGAASLVFRRIFVDTDEASGLAYLDHVSEGLAHGKG